MCVNRLLIYPGCGPLPFAPLLLLENGSAPPRALRGLLRQHSPAGISSEMLVNSFRYLMHGLGFVLPEDSVVKQTGWGTNVDVTAWRKLAYASESKILK